MAGYTIDATGANNQIGSDAIHALEFYYWLKERYAVWNQNLSTTQQMTTAGIASADQSLFTAVEGAFNILIEAFEGTIGGQNNVFALNAVRGIA
jgi:hypothetical protein